MKKFLSTCLTAVCLMVALSFSACDCEHTYGEWNTIKEADCTEGGKMVRYCQECGVADELIVDPLGHNIVDGVCTVCGHAE